jgi:hypothetical protein
MLARFLLLAIATLAGAAAQQTAPHASPPAHVEVRWSELGLMGTHRVHDVWSDGARGSLDGSFAADVEPHGVVLIRVQ